MRLPPRLTPTAFPFLNPDFLKQPIMAILQMPVSSGTLPGVLLAKSMSSRQDFLVNPSAMPESRSALTTPGTSARPLCDLLNDSDPAQWLLKTLIGMPRWHSTSCRLVWKRKATPAGRAYYQLAASVRPTDDTDSLWWLYGNPASGSKQLKTVLYIELSPYRHLPLPQPFSPANYRFSVPEHIPYHRWLLPTPVAKESSTRNLPLVDKQGNAPTHPHQRWYHAETGRLVQKDLWGVIERLLPTPDRSLATGGKLTSLDRVSDTGMTIDGKKRQISLADAIRRQLLPTTKKQNQNVPALHGSGGPDLQTVVAATTFLRVQCLSIPTPRESEWKGTGPVGSKSHQHDLDKGRLGATVAQALHEMGDERTTADYAVAERSKLQPAMTEWMMGMPQGWTDPDMAVDYWSTCPEPGDKGGSPEWIAPWQQVALLTCTPDDPPNRPDRLAATGNALVPQLPYEIFGLLEQLLTK